MPKSNKTEAIAPKRPETKTSNRNIAIIAFIAILAAIAVAIILVTNQPSENGPVHATWLDKDTGRLTAGEITLKSAGDNVTFVYEDDEYTLPNTEIIFWREHNKTFNEAKSDAYRFNVTYMDGSAETAICYEYKNDPACKDSPGYLVYAKSHCYHVSENRVKFMPVEQND